MFQSIVLRGMLPVLLLTGACGVMAAPDKSSSAPVHLGNPIRPLDTADPGVVRSNGKWYVYHTNTIREKGRYPIVVSDDLTDWKAVGYIFQDNNMPTWCDKSRSWWAPEVHKVNDKYIAYYTARQNGSDRFAVGAAVAPSPEGPPL